MKLPQNFELLPVLALAGSRTADPVMRIRVKAGKTRTGCFLKLNSSVLQLIGIDDRRSGGHVQVLVSSVGVKVVKCQVNSEGARRLNGDGSVLIHELLRLVDLKDGDIFDLDAYAADPNAKGRGSAAIGSFPFALRERVSGASHELKN